MTQKIGTRENRKVIIGLATNRVYKYILIPIIKEGATIKDWIEICEKIWDELISQNINLFKIKEKETERKRSEKIKWKVFKRDNFRCRKCKSQEFLEVDHINPISKGGNGNIENLQTLCQRCNRKKSNKI